LRTFASVLVWLCTMPCLPVPKRRRPHVPGGIRYTSMSLPYHIGDSWFGGFHAVIGAVGLPRKGK
jgi:hypothetical protein